MQHVTRYAGQAIRLVEKDGRSTLVLIESVSIGGRVRLKVDAPADVKIEWVEEPQPIPDIAIPRPVA